MKYDYQGFWGCSSFCEVQMSKVGDKTVIILTEVEDNPGTSVTNMVEHLAEKLVNEYSLDPAHSIIIEHYPERGPRYDRYPEQYDLVEPDWERDERERAWTAKTPTARHMWRALTPLEIEQWTRANCSAQWPT